MHCLVESFQVLICHNSVLPIVALFWVMQHICFIMIQLSALVPLDKQVQIPSWFDIKYPEYCDRNWALHVPVYAFNALVYALFSDVQLIDSDALHVPAAHIVPMAIPIMALCIFIFHLPLFLCVPYAEIKTPPMTIRRLEARNYYNK